jgi:hypothetical protein
MVKVSERVLADLDQIRTSGEINMMDRNGVQMIANEESMYELVIWIQENPKLYGMGIFEGFGTE